MPLQGAGIANTPVDAPVAIPSVQGAAQVRDLLVTLNVGGVPTPVVMSVVALANPDGSLLDMNVAAREQQIIDLLLEIRRELMILNEVMVQGQNLSLDLDAEYRADPMFGSAAAVGTVP